MQWYASRTSDITCSAEQLVDGRWRGNVLIHTFVVGAHLEEVYTCPETDSTEVQAKRRAMTWASENHPPG